MTTVFSTTRLELRRFTVSDATGFYALNLDPEVIRFTGDPPFGSIAEAEEFIRQYDHYKKYGFGRWSVYLIETGEYLGFCGLNYSSQKAEVDVGFRFMRRYWGKGYATEASRASLLHGFGVYGLDRIAGRAMKDNPASLRVLQKIGMHYQKEFIEDGVLWTQYEITREEFGDGSNGSL